jgi:hypothetical protein
VWLEDAGSGWLAITFAFETYVETFENASYFYETDETDDCAALRVAIITPRHSGTCNMLMMRGDNLSIADEDYTNIYFGAGPQGGFIGTGTKTTHAICRPDVRNLVVDMVTSKLGGASLPVIAEDAVVGNGSPNPADVVACELGETRCRYATRRLVA